MVLSWIAIILSSDHLVGDAALLLARTSAELQAAANDMVVDHELELVNQSMHEAKEMSAITNETVWTLSSMALLTMEQFGAAGLDVAKVEPHPKNTVSLLQGTVRDEQRGDHTLTQSLLLQKAKTSLVETVDAGIRSFTQAAARLAGLSHDANRALTKAVAEVRHVSATFRAARKLLATSGVKPGFMAEAVARFLAGSNQRNHSITQIAAGSCLNRSAVEELARTSGLGAFCSQLTVGRRSLFSKLDRDNDNCISKVEWERASSTASQDANVPMSRREPQGVAQSLATRAQKQQESEGSKRLEDAVSRKRSPCQNALIAIVEANQSIPLLRKGVEALNWTVSKTLDNALHTALVGMAALNQSSYVQDNVKTDVLTGSGLKELTRHAQARVSRKAGMALTSMTGLPTFIGSMQSRTSALCK